MPSGKPTFSSEDLARFRSLIEGSQHVLLVCHARPDGDAMGSTLALALLLRERGLHVECMPPTEVPAPLQWLPGSQMVVSFNPESPLATQSIARADLIIHLDHADTMRLDPPLQALVNASKAPKVAIDHHLFPKNEEFELLFTYPQSSSTCELLYELATALWGEEAISAPVAQCLYTGLMTDTGSFSYNCSRGRTYEVGGKLVEAGAKVREIQDHVLRSYKANRLFMYGHALAHHTEFFAAGRAAIITLPQSLLNEYSQQPGDTEGLVNEPLSVAGCLISVMISQRTPRIVRVSLRARGEGQVNTIARESFNGGGHPQASGGQLEMPLEEAKSYAMRIIEEGLEQGVCLGYKEG